MDATKSPKTRHATDADRDVARQALEQAGIDIADMERELNKYAKSWTVKDCRGVMLYAGMSEETVNAACPLTLEAPLCCRMSRLKIFFRNRLAPASLAAIGER